MAVDALAPDVARSSTAMVLLLDMQDICVQGSHGPIA